MKLKLLIETQQHPESRKTKGDHTKVKLLHNQFTQRKLYVDQDDVIMLKSPDGKFNGSVISIPPSLYPGITNFTSYLAWPPKQSPTVCPYVPVLQHSRGKVDQR